MPSQHSKNSLVCSLGQATEIILPSSQLLSLPTEVLDLVFHQVGKADLKNARLSCTSLLLITDSILFREVVVVPHYGSLNGLVQLAQHLTLRNHVQQLTVDNRWGIIMRSSKTEELAKMRDEFVGDAVMGDADVDVAYLSRAFSMLPALTSLRFRAVGTLRAQNSTLEEMPSYYIRYLERLGPMGDKDISSTGGLKRWVSPTVAWLAVFSAGICLRTVRADGLDPYIFSQKRRFESIRIAFRSLQHLQLSFRLPEYGDNLLNVAGLVYLLSELPALESLDLSGFGVPRNPVDPPRFGDYLNLGTMLKRTLHYPRLVRLSFQGFYALESEIMLFMEKNAASLESLRLANIILTRILHDDEELSGLEAAPCWVEFMHGLQTKLNLKHMEFDEYLGNRENQNWCIDGFTEAGPNCLKDQVENFVVNGGECPLDCCAVNKRDDITEEERGLRDGGDASWCDCEPCHSDRDVSSDAEVDDSFTYDYGYEYEADISWL